MIFTILLDIYYLFTVLECIIGGEINNVTKNFEDCRMNCKIDGCHLCGKRLHQPMRP